MMETILNLGLNDRTVDRPRAAERQRALRLRFVSPLHPDVLATSCSASRSSDFEHLLKAQAHDDRRRDATPS